MNTLMKISLIASVVATLYSCDAFQTKETGNGNATTTAVPEVVEKKPDTLSQAPVEKKQDSLTSGEAKR